MKCVAAAFVLAMFTHAFCQPNAAGEANQALELARQGKYELAIPHYREALRKDPAMPGLYLNLGLALFKLARLDEASSAFEHAVQADPKNFQARVLLGMSYFGTRKFSS